MTDRAPARPRAPRRRTATVAALLSCAAAASARADDGLAAQTILERPAGARLESLRVRFTHYDQDGHGFQSQAGPTPLSAGSEQLTVEQPQVEAVIRHNDKVKTRLWLPLDIVSAASPDANDKYRALDAMSSASRVNEGGSIDFTTTYQADRRSAVFVRAGFHLEENFRSYNLGAGVEHRFADDNATVFASVNQVVDWFDAYKIDGQRLDHVWRSSTNANLGLTQLLSPSTLVALNYGFTFQDRHLGVTWNSVPLSDGTRGEEILPSQRHRHAIVGRIAQAMPWWGGAVKASYRFYADSWGVAAHSAEWQVLQRLAPWIYLRASYRLHYQNGVYFWRAAAQAGATDYRSADSDLAAFFAHTFGGRVVLEGRRLTKKLRDAELNLGYEYYVRTNDLRVHILSCGIGLRF